LHIFANCRDGLVTERHVGTYVPPQALGLAVLMAKAGLQVPATPPVRLPPFSAVLADIGDEQSLSASLSTFSGHLRRIQAGCQSRAPVTTFGLPSRLASTLP